MKYLFAALVLWFVPAQRINPVRLAPCSNTGEFVVFEKRKEHPPVTGYDMIAKKAFDLRSYRGNSTILAFGASYCDSCKMELNHLIEQHNSGRIKVLYVDGDVKPATGASWLRSAKVPFPVLWDQDKLHNEWGVQVYPTCFLIGPDGKVEAYTEGYDHNTFSKMVTMGQRLLPKPVDIGPLLPQDVGPLIPQ